LGLKIRIFNFLFNFQGAHLKLLKTIIILLSSERRKVFSFCRSPGVFTLPEVDRKLGGYFVVAFLFFCHLQASALNDKIILSELCEGALAYFSSAGV